MVNNIERKEEKHKRSEN